MNRKSYLFGLTFILLCFGILLVWSNWGTDDNVQDATNPSVSLREKRTALRSYRKRWLVVLGINSYSLKDVGLNGLHTAVADAQSIYKLLNEEYGFNTSLSDEFLLLDNDATQANFSKTLAKLDTLVGKDDCFVFVFTGHGIRDADSNETRLVLFDSNVKRMESCLSLQKVQNQIQNLSCRHKAIMLGCCYSGRLFDDKSVSIGEPLYSANNTMLNYQLANPSMEALTSSQDNRTFDAFGDGTHSAFMTNVLKELSSRCDSDLADQRFTFRQLSSNVVKSLQKEGTSIQYPQYGKLPDVNGSIGVGEVLFFPTELRQTRHSLFSATSTKDSIQAAEFLWSQQQYSKAREKLFSIANADRDWLWDHVYKKYHSELKTTYCWGTIHSLTFVNNNTLAVGVETSNGNSLRLIKVDDRFQAVRDSIKTACVPNVVVQTPTKLIGFGKKAEWFSFPSSPKKRIAIDSPVTAASAFESQTQVVLGHGNGTLTIVGDSLEIVQLPSPHTSEIVGLFDIDGASFYSIDDTGLCCKWNADKHELISDHDFQTSITSVDFDPANGFLFVTDKHEVFLQGTADDQKRTSLNFGGSSAKWLPRYDLTAILQDQGVKIVDPYSQTILISLEGHDFGEIGAFAVSPNGQFIITSGGDDQIRIWDLDSFLPFRLDAEAAVLSLHPKGGLLLTTENGGTVLHLENGSWQKKLRVKEVGQDSNIVWSDDQQLLGVINGDSVDVFSLRDGRLAASFKTSDQAFTCLAFIPESSLIVLGTTNGLIEVGDVKLPNKLSSIRTTGGSITTLKVTNDNSAIYVGTADYPGSFAHVKKYSFPISEDQVQEFFFSVYRSDDLKRVVGIEQVPNGDVLAGFENGTVAIWNTNGQLQKLFRTGSALTGIHMVEYPILVCEQDNIHFWNCDLEQEVASIEMNANIVGHNPSGGLTLSTNAGRYIRLGPSQPNYVVHYSTKPAYSAKYDLDDLFVSFLKGSGEKYQVSKLDSKGEKRQANMIRENASLELETAPSARILLERTDNQLTARNLDSYLYLWRFDDYKKIKCIAVDTGTTVVTNGSEIQVLDTFQGLPVGKPIKLQEKCTCMAVCESSGQLAIALESGYVEIWNFKTRKRIGVKILESRPIT